MGKSDRDGDSYALPDLPGKVRDDDSPPSSSASSTKMSKKSKVANGSDHFDEVDLHYGTASASPAVPPTRRLFTSRIGSGQGDQLNLSQMTNGVYRSNGGFSEDINKNHKTLHESIDYEKTSTTTNREKSEFEKLTPVPFIKLFRFSSCQDRLLIFLAILAAVCGGCTLPVMIVLFGDLTNAFVTNGIDLSLVCEFLPQCCTDGFMDFNATTCNVTPEMIANFMPALDFFEEITKFGTGTGCIGFINFVMGYIFVTCLNHAAECQVYRIRGLFLQSILRQDIGWYDTHQTGDFAAKMTEDLNKLQEGIGEKIGMFIFFMTIFLASIINAFIHGWELTLVILAAMPVLSLSLGMIARSQATLTEKEMEAYGKAGAIAEEVLSAIRTVVAFGGQQKEVKRYESRLVHARRAGIMRGLLTGVGGGLMWFIIYSSYALAFWYGVKLIMDDRESCLADLSTCRIRYDPSSLLIVFFSVLMGAMNVGQAAPYVEAFSMAKSAAAAIFTVIDRKPPIDTLSEEGDILPEETKNLEGARNIVFENVHFNYPARMDVSVLAGLNLTIKKGETVALVGQSGCGKSTCIQLIQRFYDPDLGCIKLGGRNIKDLNISWLRDRIGVVGQEPVLFGYTIAENIQFGRDGVTQEEMDKACKEANAYDFIMKLPKKFNTLVGERGAQLSGGQKQRIAIARALVRNPEILLLDEATSALDTQSESIVQAALDKARSGRTTVVVAHRLSTIRTADTIVTLKDGKVAEIGTHVELMKKQGLYFSLVTAQLTQERNAIDEENDGIDEDLENGDHTLPSLMSVTSSLGGLDSFSSIVRPSFRRKSFVDRKISVSSIMSDDSMDVVEEAGRAVGSAVGLARMNSTPLRESRRRKRSLVQQDSVLDPQAEDEDLPEVDTLRILKTNGPEWPYILLGALASVVMGASMPVYAILFGEVLGILSEPVDEARAHSVTYSVFFLIVGCIVGLAMFLQVAMFTVAGEHLTLRMRKMAFESMVRQEMGWFDQPTNNTGALCARLSADAAAIQGATGSRFGAMVQSVFTILLAICAGIYHDWKLGLVSSLFVPFVLVGSVFQAKIMSSQDNVEREAFAKSAKLAVEAISNIRTVAGLCREKTFVERYIEELRQPHETAKKKAHVRGLVFGFAQAMPFFAYAGCMYYGGYLVSTEDLPYRNVFKVAEALILGTMMVGQATAFAPNYNKAVVAAARVFKLLDRAPLIDGDGQSGVRLNRIEGNISFKDADFSYPTRPQVNVLKSLSLSLTPGQKIALVGPSGCGKSTCIHLLQRFYNLHSGEMLVDDHNAESLNVPWVRSRIGIVSQEPILFDGTLAENIRYGDNTRKASMDEVVEAARQANIHSFIASLPQGYETKVGEKGTQLSGGQKQRVAIARALLRNPDILLLDEATSALDTESEKVVQEALDNAQEGRTSITIAHRLSTIQQVDKIFVISRGRVAESGTHQQLLSHNGIYAKLWSKQIGSTRKHFKMTDQKVQ